MKRLLALDVGFSATGFTVWEKGQPVHAGLLTTEKSSRKSTRVADDYSWRSAKLARDLVSVINQWSVAGIVGELPSGGSQNARAAVQMGMANAVVSVVAEMLRVPVEWCTPMAVKKALTGRKDAAKMDMMLAAIEQHGGDVDVKRISAPKTAKGYREQVTFKFIGRSWPAGKFEHIADSVGVYEALKGGNLVRMFG